MLDPTLEDAAAARAFADDGAEGVATKEVVVEEVSAHGCRRWIGRRVMVEEQPYCREMVLEDFLSQPLPCRSTKGLSVVTSLSLSDAFCQTSFFTFLDCSGNTNR